MIYFKLHFCPNMKILELVTGRGVVRTVWIEQSVGSISCFVPNYTCVFKV